MAQANTKEAVEAARDVVQKAIIVLAELQSTPDKSREIAISITHLETAEMWLEKAVKAVK